MDNRLKVLTALVGAERPVSGERIAQSLGISRAAVAKHVKALRDGGCGIDVVKGSGYRLVSLPSEAVPFGVAPLVHSRFWTSIEGGALTLSTNDDARALAARGAAEGTVVVASQQSSGRGRLGREWSSPGGGAYFSAILRPAVPAEEATSLPLAIALGVAAALEDRGVPARIKWPNDVLIDSEKVAGILLEMSTEAERISWIVAGVGLNVVRPAYPFEGAAYLSDHLSSITPAEACAAVLDSVAETYLRWSREGFAALRPEYSRLDALRGCMVAVTDAFGGLRAEGAAEGVDESGRLLVNQGDGTVAVSSGEATLTRL